MATRNSEKRRQQTSQKKQSEDKLKSGTYILERTRAFFTGRSDKPNSGAARFGPYSGAARRVLADSRAAPLRPAVSVVAASSPARSGAEPTTSTTVGDEPWPLPATRDTWTFGAPLPRMSSDCKRRGAALGSATGCTVGADAKSDDLPRDRRLCKESESGHSDLS
jgi:hypothetical protein